MLSDVDRIAAQLRERWGGYIDIERRDEADWRQLVSDVLQIASETPSDQGRHSPLWLLDAGEEHLRLAMEYKRRLNGLPWWDFGLRAHLRDLERHHREVSDAFFQGAASFAGVEDVTQ